MREKVTREAWPARGVPVFYVVLVVVGMAVASALGYVEYHFSRLQARYFSGVASQLKFKLEPGPSASIRFPHTGPYDHRLGYAELPSYLERLESRGYKVAMQAQLTPELSRLIAAGYSPPYREKDHAGLQVLDCRGETIFNFGHPERHYPEFAAIPRVVADTLLFIENRELLDPTYPTRNPAVEWARLGRAAVGHVAKVFDPDYEAPGGSTLATQLVKYRHSPGGVTTSAFEKLRQMYSASLRAYANGTDTSEARRRIVLDYLNTVPLAAAAGYGEVNGLGDGLWTWYGADFDAVNKLLQDLSDRPELDRKQQARAFRQVLSLLIAQRRPTYLLGRGRERLAALTDSYLRLLANARVIPDALRDAALSAPVALRDEALGPPQAEIRSWKAANVVRYKLVSLLETPRLYDIDRLDLAVRSTLDARMQDAVANMLQRLREPAYVKSAKLQEERLLAGGDPSAVLYSFTLYEKGKDANLVRVQTDSFGQPFDTNDGAKLELGSTAKLRTLATYLDVIASLHGRYGGLSREALRDIPIHRKDAITRWSIGYLSQASDKSLSAMLEAAMERRYSASPSESFFTGGGLHTFSNFKHEDDLKVPTVREALRNSVNLAFVRVMRDIVHHYMYRSTDTPARLLEDDRTQREAYLTRFADHEGLTFIRNFYRKYHGLNDERALESLLDGVRPTPVRLAVVYRSVRPEASLEEFRTFLRQRVSAALLPDRAVASLYGQYSQEHYSLQDRGYLAHVHPLELWLAGYLHQRPDANLRQVVNASARERQDVYRWLFKTKARAAQDKRIGMVIEREAFTQIHNHWKRLGYPFGSLVPSYATAIGVSGDRPAALAELIGIILNDGVRNPTARVVELHFASGTPYETIVRPDTAARERVMAPEVAAALKRTLLAVVEGGTARRVHGAYTLPDKTQLKVGGKTGTGDNRLEVYGAHGQLIQSKSVNRTAAFAFFLGDRYFGVIAAYVPAPFAANYNFTSALPVQILKNLAPELLPYLNPETADRCAEQP